MRNFRSVVLAVVLSAPAATVASAAEEARELDIPQAGQVDTIQISGDFLDLVVEGRPGPFDGEWRSVGRGEADAGSPEPLVGAIVNGDTLLLKAEGDSHRYVLHLGIPAHWQVRAQVYRYGEIRLSGLKGQVSAWSAGGPILVEDQAGPFSLTAMSGIAKASFVADHLPAPSAITARAPGPSDVSVELLLPSSLPADVRILSAGQVASDFPEVMAVLAEEEVVASLNGGGESITVRSTTGRVQISKGRQEGEP